MVKPVKLLMATCVQIWLSQGMSGRVCVCVCVCVSSHVQPSTPREAMNNESNARSALGGEDVPKISNTILPRVFTQELEDTLFCPGANRVYEVFVVPFGVWMH